LLSAIPSNRANRPSKIVAFLIVVITMALCRISFATTITNDDPEFTLRVPPDYVQLHQTDTIRFDDGINICGFASTNATYNLPDQIIIVQKLPGTLPRDAKPDLSSPDIKSFLASYGIVDAHFVKGRWNSMDISLIDGQATKYGILFAMSAAQIPISGHAVQIVVLVRSDEGEAEAEGICRDFLDGLTGPSNWSSDSASGHPSGIVGNFLRSGLVTGAMIGIAIGVLRVLRRD
jgi:hypothetical protein